MSGHRSAGTCLSFSHCQTAPFDTPSSLARAALEPSISEALLIGFVSMIASIDYLDSKCKEILAHRGIGSLYHLQMEDKSVIARYVKSARIAAGMTQTELSEHLVMTKGNVSGWENDKHHPSPALCGLFFACDFVRSKKSKELLDSGSIETLYSVQSFRTTKPPATTDEPQASN